MKLVRKNEATEFKNSEVCTALEYTLHDPDINGAVIILKGRYPDTGWAVNTKVKEMAYIIEGQATLALVDRTITVNKGDEVLIEPNEKYFWEGDATMFVPCTPAWTPEQHQYLPY